jgi:hypothetical protein
MENQAKSNDPALQTEFVQHCSGDFLDRYAGDVYMRNMFGQKEGFGGGDLQLALFKGRIAAYRSSFRTDAVQAFGIDGQAV